MALFDFNKLSYTAGQGRQITVSASIDAGQILLIKGPSGAGKSTLLRVLARLQPYSHGQVLFNKESWLKIPPTEWRSQVHYLAQKTALFEGTVLDNLAKPFALKLVKSRHTFNQNEAEQCLKDLLLSPDLLQQDARTLSGGEAARVAFVRSLLTQPSILLLDEPTAALDKAAKDAFYAALTKWLQGENRGALMISHNEDFNSQPGITVLSIPQQEVSHGSFHHSNF